MADYRIHAGELFEILSAWDEVIPGRGKIRLIACGGTALTLLGYKDSTKDVDFLVPDLSEYERLVRFLSRAGYARITGYGWRRADENIIFDLYPGNRVYCTELLSSPLGRGGHRKVRAWKKIYLGVLNPMDLVISKMFRGVEVDIQDCLTLMKNEPINLSRLEKRYRETAQYDTSENRVLKNWALLMNRWKNKV